MAPEHNRKGWTAIYLTAGGALAAAAVLQACGDTSQVPSLCLESFSSEISGAQVGIGGGSTELAESFKHVVSAASPAPVSVTTVQLKLSSNLPPSPSPLPAPVPSPSPLLILDIEGDSGGAPSGVALTGAATLDMTQVRGPATAFYRFTFPSAAQIQPNTVYWLHLKGTGLNSSYTIYWSGNNQQGAYPNGSASVLSGGSWSGALIGPYRALLFLLGC